MKAQNPIALYKNTQYGWISVYEVNESLETDINYTRLSEPQEVEFVSRDQSEIIASQLKALAAAEEEITVKALEAIKNIQARKQELLALENKHD